MSPSSTGSSAPSTAGLLTPPSNCPEATARHRFFLMWLNLWTILLFVFGSALVLALVLLVFFAVFRQQVVQAIVTALSAVVNGAAATWVVSRQREAAKAEEAAYQEHKTACAGVAGAVPGESSADALRAEHRILGIWL